MYPKLFGIIDTYYVMFIIGIIVCLLILFFYFKKKKVSKDLTILYAINGLLSIIAGVIFANLFQNLYDYIANSVDFKYSGNMTFLGGLLMGVVFFIIFYLLFIRKKDKEVFKYILIIAPSCITAAHFFGRLGCFFNGCCYGLETNSWLGMYFPNIEKTVYPTQLFEAFFLLIVSVLTGILAFKKDFIYNLPIYFGSYGIFRFLIEYIRGDDRGQFVTGLTPSQFWSIFMVIVAIGSIFLINYLYGKNKIFKSRKKVSAD